MDISALLRIASSGLVWVIANGVSILFLLILAVFGFSSDSILFVIGILGLVWMGTCLGTCYCVGVWVYRAHHAICALRGIESRMSSFAIGTLAAIPIVFLGLPLAYALEFILIRSESPDKPTMKWSSFWSKSGPANIMAFLLVTPCICFFICLFLVGFRPGFLYFLLVPTLVCAEIGLFYGSFLVFKINKRIEILANTIAYRSIPAP